MVSVELYMGLMVVHNLTSLFCERKLSKQSLGAAFFMREG